MVFHPARCGTRELFPGGLYPLFFSSFSLDSAHGRRRNGDINKCEAHISARNGGNVAAVKSRVNADVQSNAVSFKDIYICICIPLSFGETENIKVATNRRCSKICMTVGWLVIAQQFASVNKRWKINDHRLAVPLATIRGVVI